MNNLITIAFRVQHIDTLVIYLRWARKTSTSHHCVEVFDNRVLLGRGVVSINKGTDRSGAMGVVRSNREVFQRGAESLGPSHVVDVAAASGGDGWRIYVTNVIVDLLAVDDSPSSTLIQSGRCRL